MDKRIERIANKSIAINVKTKKEYINLMKFFERNGIKWDNSDLPTEFDCFRDSRSETCIELNYSGLMYGDKSFFENDGYKIISFQDFIKKENSFTKADLKNGDIVTFRNGKKRQISGKNLVTLDDDSRIVNEVHFFRDDLTSRFTTETDIVKVERTLDYETVYERKEEILDEAEKEYLKRVIEPFKHKIIYIQKTGSASGKYEMIYIELKDSNAYLPTFKAGLMYKGMELNEEYTLEELGL